MRLRPSRVGLRLLEERNERRQIALLELRELIAVGLEEAKRGELLDGEQVMADLLRRHKEWARDEAGESGE